MCVGLCVWYRRVYGVCVVYGMCVGCVYVLHGVWGCACVKVKGQLCGQFSLPCGFQHLQGERLRLPRCLTSAFAAFVYLFTVLHSHTCAHLQGRQRTIWRAGSLPLSDESWRLNQITGLDSKYLYLLSHLAELFCLFVLFVFLLFKTSLCVALAVMEISL